MATSALFGKVGEFSAERETFRSYVERLEMFFTANGIVEVAGEDHVAENQAVKDRQKAIFLTEIGPEVYSTLSNLVAPRKPKEILLNNLIETLEKHYNPRPLEIAESFHFGTRNQKQGESVNDFIVALKKLSIHCNYGEFLNRALRDRFVCGLNNVKIQNKLLNTEDLTFDRACQIAKAMEMAEKNTQEFHPAAVGESEKGTVNQLKTEKVNSKEQLSNRSCFRCGGKHSSNTYPENLWLSSPVIPAALGVGAVVMTGALLKRYFAGGVCTSKARLDGKTVIVTGANTGIGKETALDLAARGARVILACRNEDKGVEAAREIINKTRSQQVSVRKLDMSSFDSIRKFAVAFNKEEERLDILVNNAGIFTPKHEVTEDGFESTIQVNYLSQFLLTLLLLKKLKNSSPSRIVNVSSLANERVPPEMKSDEYSWAKCSEKDFDGQRMYRWSKLQQILFTKELSKRLDGTGVTVNALHPGVVKTEIVRNVPLFNNIIFKMIMAIPAFILIKTAKQGAQTTIHCAVDESLRNVSGLYFSDCKPKEPNKLAEDKELARQLWSISEDLTGIKWEDAA